MLRGTRITRSTVPEQIIASDVESEGESNNNNNDLLSPVKVQFDTSQLLDVNDEEERDVGGDRESGSEQEDAADKYGYELAYSMGAEQSEEVNASLHAAAEQLRNEQGIAERHASLLNQARSAGAKPRTKPVSNAERNAASPQSCGKSSRPSTGKLPSIRRSGGRHSGGPALPRFSSKRPIGRQQQSQNPENPRPSEYSPEVSPQKVTRNARATEPSPNPAATEPSPKFKRKRNEDDKTEDRHDPTPPGPDTAPALQPHVEIWPNKRAEKTTFNFETGIPWSAAEKELLISSLADRMDPPAIQEKHFPNRTVTAVVMRARKITKNEINRFRMKHTFKLVETSAEDIPRPEAHRNDNASDGVLPEENAFPTSAQRETLDGPMKRKSVRPTEDPTLVQEARTRSASAAVTSPLQGTIAHADAVEDAQDLSVRRRRGRPPKRSLEKTRSPPVQDAQSTEASTAEPPPALAATETDVVEVQDLPLRRGRGRPPKRVAKKKPSSAATDTQNPGKAKSSSTRAMRSNKRAPEDESLRKTKPGEPAEQENGEVEPMESEEQEQDKESVVGAQKPIILQPFEVQFPESGDDDSGQAADGQTDRPAKTSGDEGVDARADAEQEEGQEEETVKTTRKKQRRRAKEEALQQDLTLEGEQDQTRFYSQYGKLQAALAGVYHVGLARVNQKEYRHRIKITAPVIRELADACKEMNDHIDILQDAGRPDEQTGELEPELKQRLLDLFNHAGVVLDDAADNDADLIEQVYAHAIPELTRVLKSLLVYFESCDSFSVSTKLSRLHLRTAMKLIRTITDLEEQVRTFKERHKIELEPKNLIRPVHNEIYLNLKDVHSAFAQLVSAEQKEKARTEAAARRASLQRIQDEEEERERLERRARRHVRERWETLHACRRAQFLDGKTFFARTLEEKIELRHLNTIPLDHPERQGTLELDANGQPFERVEVFAQRNSLAPGFRPKHEAEEWPLEHSRALGEGLARFAGPMVYEQIFREYCHRDGILRPYNVSQIVAKALDIREAMIRLNEEEGKETEQWVLNIPDPTVYLPQG